MTIQELLESDITASDLAEYIQENISDLNSFSGHLHEQLTSILAPVIEHFNVELLSLQNEINDSYYR